ncbi:MAG: nucleotidyltransferase domain-containing protein [Candidatus Shapirobacteria bacterium]
MKLDDSIKKTIAYAKKHGCELNFEEIKERLISSEVYGDEDIKKILFKNPLPDKSGFPLDEGGKLKEIKIKKAKKLALLLKKKFKNILMVGVTGSVAAGHPKKNDDIDIIIITRKNALWQTRLKLRFFIYINQIPHRKYGQKENKDEFCFNFWLDEDNLLLPKSRQHLRSAVDLILMKPILNRENTYGKFILENSWAKKWVINGYSKIDVRSSMLDRRNRNNYFGWVLNLLIFIPQYLFMRRKIRNEEVSLKQAFFHTKDNHKPVKI